MTLAELSRLENESIFDFVQGAALHGYLHGRVLDYGCGEQPYREIVEAVGEYVPWDRAKLPGLRASRNIGRDDPLQPQAWDAILSTQVAQYVPDVYLWLREIRDALVPGGHLVLTYPAAWPETGDDLWRFTKHGMERLLKAAGFAVVRHEARGTIPLADLALVFGYGAVARAGP